VPRAHPASVARPPPPPRAARAAPPPAAPAPPARHAVCEGVWAPAPSLNVLLMSFYLAQLSCYCLPLCTSVHPPPPQPLARFSVFVVRSRCEIRPHHVMLAAPCGMANLTRYDRDANMACAYMGTSLARKRRCRRECKAPGALQYHRRLTWPPDLRPLRSFRRVGRARPIPYAPVRIVPVQMERVGVGKIGEVELGRHHLSLGICF
jgi:hypothetical protein